MAKEDAFTPRLGKIRDRGAAGGARLRKRVTSTAKHLSQGGRRSGFKGIRLGRGGASAMHAHYQARAYANQRMRRVVIKTHIAKPGKVVGAGVFSKHLNYLQRDGVERDGSGGELYTRGGKNVDVDAFVKRSARDRHQFRFIVSPEDANEIGDLKSYTHDLMDVMERDLGTRLDWVAVDHHNTGRSHTHIVVRGRDAAKRDLVIAPDYIGRGFRERASVLATERLGPRRELEIMHQQAREVEQDRLTGIDRQLLRLEQSHEIEIPKAITTKDRFVRDLQLQRLKHLRELRLAEQESPGVWHMQPQWNNTLKAMGQRGDIIKAIAAGLEPGRVPEQVRFFNERAANAAPLVGTVHRHGPSDELRDTRYLLVRDFDGNIWHAEAGVLKDGALPPLGAVVQLQRREGEPRRSDKTIAQIAQRAGGYYSEEIHSELDPSSSAAYRLAHKRRLEALRRSGVAPRGGDGRWRIDEHFLNRVRAHEGARMSVKIETRSWLSLNQQVTAIGETWLDCVDHGVVSGASDQKLSQAKQERLQHLRDRGVLPPSQSELTERSRIDMNAVELKEAQSRLSQQSGRKPITPASGTSFEGVFERTFNLGQGRFALIGKPKEFALVPWRTDMERYRGQSLVIETRQRGIGWSLPGTVKRGISR